MKSIVIYYSFEGNTKLIAHTVQEVVGAGLIQLQVIEERKSKLFTKYFWGGRQVMTKKEPELQPYSFNAGDFDLIFLGTPVWAWHFTPAMRSFLKKEQFSNKKIALFCCHAGVKGEILTRWKDVLAGNEIIGEIDFRDPLRVKTEKNIQRAKTWAQEMVEKCSN